MADEADNAQAHISRAVQVGVPAPGDARLPAQQIGEDPAGGHPPQHIRAQIPVHGRDNIVIRQGIAHSHRNGFVAPLAEGTAQPPALPVESDHSLVEGAGQGHPIVDFQFLFGGEGFVHGIVG